MVVASEGITTSYLLKRILGWYADSRNWVPAKKPEFSLTRPNRVIQKDKTRFARLALETQSTGQLISLVCDAYGISLTHLAKRSNISQPRMYDIVNGCELTEAESVSIRGIFDIID